MKTMLDYINAVPDYIDNSQINKDYSSKKLVTSFKMVNTVQ